MSKKKEKEWKQRLTAAMNAEAEEIEKQAEPFHCLQKKFLAPAPEADRSAGGSGGADLQYDTDQ